MQSNFTAADVKLIGKDTVFNGYYSVDRYHLQHRQHEGGMGLKISREIFERGHAAAVLPYDPDLDKLVFIEQFRPGAYAALTSPWYQDDNSPWLLEIISGIIEKGEDPAEMVRREAVEEAGCKILNLELIAHYLVTPGGSSESVHSYCGRVDASSVGGIHGLAEEGENIRVLTMTPAEAFAALDAGLICNSMTMIALQWFRFNYDRLCKQWQRAD